MSGELAAERWSPAQRVESVLISILSLLDDAEVSSPANVDAAVMLRTNPEDFRSMVKAQVKESRKSTPPGFEMPTYETPKAEVVEKEDPDFWAESGDDSDPFGGSDSDEDLDMDNLTGSEEDDDMDAEDEEL